MIPPRWFLRTGWAMHRAVFAVTGHRVGARRPPGDGQLGWLFLLARGRTTGTIRRTGLYYVEDGPNLAVVASNAGAAADPSWWRNLQAHPEATIEIGRTATRVRAREATPEERARIWPQFVAAQASYADYERSTTRRIPVVVLEPLSEG